MAVLVGALAAVEVDRGVVDREDRVEHFRLGAHLHVLAAVPHLGGEIAGVFEHAHELAHDAFLEFFTSGGAHASPSAPQWAQ